MAVEPPVEVPETVAGRQAALIRQAYAHGVLDDNAATILLVALDLVCRKALAERLEPVRNAPATGDVSLRAPALVTAARDTYPVLPITRPMSASDGTWAHLARTLVCRERTLQVLAAARARLNRAA